MIRIDFTDTGARIKPLHGIGQPPTRGNDCGMFHYLTEAGIPFSRLHDVGGYFGGGRFVDIPNLFPDPDADPADPASYRFGFTDLLVTELMKSGTEPFFRLGVTIENEWAVYAARIWPPRDSLAWAKICEGVIRHYTEGWADGFHYPIRYWEIWNEPDNVPDPMENPMWRGSAEQFFELYATASTYLKEKFPHLKIGGYGSCGFYGVTGGNVPTYAATSPRFDYFRTFFDDFLAYVKAHNCPLDFFSWHSYDSVPSTGMFAAYARHRLDAEGFTETETTCDEWNCNPTLRGTRMHAALCTAMFAELQHAPVDSAMFYDGRCGVSMFSSLFNPLTEAPFPAYYAFLAFNVLYRLGQEVAVYTEQMGEAGQADAALRVLAARGEKDGAARGAVLICNPTGTSLPLELSANGRLTSCSVLTEDGLAEIPLPAELESGAVLLAEYAL